jgi:hypothetical protein
MVGEPVSDVRRVRGYPDVELVELAPRDAGPQRSAGTDHDRGDVEDQLVDETLVDCLGDDVAAPP